MSERFKPKSIIAPKNLLGRIMFRARMLGDLQLMTIYRDLQKILPKVRGDVLDVGCGLGPYRHLLVPECTTYTGLDIVDADQFGFGDEAVVRFDGRHIPFPDSSFDHIICTEVLEHAREPKDLVDEIYRVLKPGASATITVPWSARNHYIPNDYQRYTPAKLVLIFGAFRHVHVMPRGTDITAIASKLVVVAMRLAVPLRLDSIWRLPLLAVLSPVLSAALSLGHLATRVSIGSDDDPIGYTIELEK